VPANGGGKRFRKSSVSRTGNLSRHHEVLFEAGDGRGANLIVTLADSEGVKREDGDGALRYFDAFVRGQRLRGGLERLFTCW